MKDADLQSAPAEEMLDDDGKPSRWRERGLWILGCVFASFVIGGVEFAIVASGIWCFHLPDGYLLGAVAGLLLFLITAVAGIIGAVGSAIYSGRTGVGMLILIHCSGMTLLTGLMLGGGGGHHLLVPFLILAALAEGTAAILLLRPAPSETAKPSPEESDLGPLWWERILWGLGCALAAVGMNDLLGTICWGIYWTPGIGWESKQVIGVLFVETFLSGIVALVAGFFYPGRTAVITTLLAHSIGWVVYSGLVAHLAPQGNVFLPHFLVAALVCGGLACLVVGWAYVADRNEFHSKPPAERNW